MDDQGFTPEEMEMVRELSPALQSIISNVRHQLPFTLCYITGPGAVKLNEDTSFYRKLSQNKLRSLEAMPEGFAVYVDLEEDVNGDPLDTFLAGFFMGTASNMGVRLSWDRSGPRFDMEGFEDPYQVNLFTVIAPGG